MVVRQRSLLAREGNLMYPQYQVSFDVCGLSLQLRLLIKDKDLRGRLLEGRPQLHSFLYPVFIAEMKRPVHLAAVIDCLLKLFMVRRVCRHNRYKIGCLPRSNTRPYHNARWGHRV